MNVNKIEVDIPDKKFLVPFICLSACVVNVRNSLMIQMLHQMTVSQLTPFNSECITMLTFDKIT